MESVLARAGIWLAILFVAVLGIAGAADTAFAVHMGIVALAACICLWVSLSSADYTAIARGILRTPPDQGQYDDDPVRWGIIATVFWGMAGFLAGLFIALQLAFRRSTLVLSGRHSAGCDRSTLLPSFSHSEAMR